MEIFKLRVSDTDTGASQSDVCRLNVSGEMLWWNSSENLVVMQSCGWKITRFMLQGGASEAWGTTPKSDGYFFITM